MARQTELNGEIAGVEEAVVYFRPARSEQTTVEPTKQEIQSPAELEDVGELLSHIKRNKLRYPIPISDSNMDELPSDHAVRILTKGREDMYITQLLSLFCSSLQGKQLMPNKYAMLIHFGDSFLLAHVKAERGMSLKEDEEKIELIRRFLDVDNILSAALFEMPDDEVVFSHFTDTGSDSFREFLGVRKRQFHYEKKNIQIICYYYGMKKIEAKFEFTNDEFDTVWLQEESVELSGDQFTPVEEDRPHQVKEIRWGNEVYESIERFKSDFKEYSFGLEGERKRYERIHQYPSDDSDTSVYSYEEAIDFRDRIELITSDGDRETLNKGTLPDDLHVLYASSHIRLDSGFADRIFSGIVSNLESKIYHPSQDAAADEYTVNNITFLNLDENALSSELKEVITRIHNHAINRTGETVSSCLVMSMLHILQREVGDSFQDGINQIININSGRPSDQDIISTKEDETAALIDYKNRQFLEGENPASKIVNQIASGGGTHDDAKIFMFGFTEQSRQIEGFETQSWNDDRVSGLEKAVQEELSDNDFDYNEFLLQPIELGAEGDRWIIIGIYY